MAGMPDAPPALGSELSLTGLFDEDDLTVPPPPPPLKLQKTLSLSLLEKELLDGADAPPPPPMPAGQSSFDGLSLTGIEISCSVAGCTNNDFASFCDRCMSFWCLAHFADHSCTKQPPASGHNLRRQPCVVCPICSTMVRVRRGDSRDAVLDAHLSVCRGAAAAAAGAAVGATPSAGALAAPPSAPAASSASPSAASSLASAARSALAMDDAAVAAAASSREAVPAALPASADAAAAATAGAAAAATAGQAAGAAAAAAAAALPRVLYTGVTLPAASDSHGVKPLAKWPTERREPPPAEKPVKRRRGKRARSARNIGKPPKRRRGGGQPDPAKEMERQSKLYVEEYTRFMTQHGGAGISPQSQNMLRRMLEVVDWPAVSLGCPWNEETRLQALESMAKVLMLNALQIVVWNIYLHRLGWFQPGFAYLESLCMSAFAVKMHLTETHIMFVPYLNQNWPSFSDRFNIWLTLKTSRSRLSIPPIELNKMFELLNQPAGGSGDRAASREESKEGE